MLSIKTKHTISEVIQAILQTVKDDELPDGEIQFILHVDGKESWSWANIRNNGKFIVMMLNFPNRIE